MSDRPFLVTLVGALNMVLGILVVFGAIMCFMFGTQNLHDVPMDSKTLADIEKLIVDTGMDWPTLCKVAGVTLLIPGIIDLVIGFGLLRGWKIMWWIGIVLNTLGALSALTLVVSAASSSMWWSVAYYVALAVVNAIIIWYMMTPNVKRFFNI